MYKKQYNMPQGKTATCPQCKGNRFRLSYNKLECTNCDWSEKTTNNKYGAVRTEFNGKKYDSKYEAGVAQTLELRKMTKDILDYETQYKIEAWAYDEIGQPAIKVSHKVDFRIHHNDGSFELVEAKGVPTEDYKWRRKFLEELWLPFHKDHTYTVVQQNAKKRY